MTPTQLDTFFETLQQHGWRVYQPGQIRWAERNIPSQYSNAVTYLHMEGDAVEVTSFIDLSFGAHQIHCTYVEEFDTAAAAPGDLYGKALRKFRREIADYFFGEDQP